MRHMICAAAIAVSLVVTGCVSKTTEKEQYSGFLKDYSKLEETTSDSGQPVLRYINPKISQYKGAALMLDTPVLYPAPQPSEQVSQKTISDIKSYMDKSMKKEVGSVVTLSPVIKPGTLHLRTAITGVEVHMEKMHVYEILPIAAVISGVSLAAGGRDRYIEVYVEAEVTDGTTGEVLLQAVRKLLPEKGLENSKAQLTLADVQPSLDQAAADAKNMAKKYIGK